VPTRDGTRPHWRGYFPASLSVRWATSPMAFAPHPCAIETVQLLRASYEDLTDCFESNANVAVSLNSYSTDPPVRTIEILRTRRCTITA